MSIIKMDRLNQRIVVVSSAIRYPVAGIDMASGRTSGIQGSFSVT
jgi:hypothetical protein